MKDNHFLLYLTLWLKRMNLSKNKTANKELCVFEFSVINKTYDVSHISSESPMLFVTCYD